MWPVIFMWEPIYNVSGFDMGSFIYKICIEYSGGGLGLYSDPGTFSAQPKPVLSHDQHDDTVNECNPREIAKRDEREKP